MSSSPTDHAIAVEMPQMGVSVAEGTIQEWLKHPGDWVEADETICVVTTDKVDVEIPSPASGRLERVLVPDGETADVGTVLAEIDGSARPGEAHRAEETEEAGEPEAATAEAATPDDQDGGPDRSGFYSPVVKRMADKHGVDLSSLRGTGIGGRVRKRDLIAHLETAGEAAEEGAAPSEPTERPMHIESPYRPEPEPAPGNGAATPAGTRGDEAGAAQGDRREPMSPMRKRIAEHMLESRRTSAHCTTIVEVDLAAVVAARAADREAMKARGVSLTYLAFVAMATVEALGRHPILNASVEGEEIVHHADVNLGIAVALETGLIVPVVKQAQRLSLEGMAAAIGDVAKRARDGALEPDDVHGGTFTITNPGQFGAVLATPIINQPQVGILDLEAVVKRPVVIDDGDGDAIAIRPMTNLCMSWDHRALDGAVAARFLAEVKDRLEGWGAER